MGGGTFVRGLNPATHSTHREAATHLTAGAPVPSLNASAGWVVPEVTSAGYPSGWVRPAPANLVVGTQAHPALLASSSDGAPGSLQACSLGERDRTMVHLEPAEGNLAPPSRGGQPSMINLANFSAMAAVKRDEEGPAPLNGLLDGSPTVMPGLRQVQV